MSAANWFCVFRKGLIGTGFWCFTARIGVSQSEEALRGRVVGGPMSCISSSSSARSAHAAGIIASWRAQLGGCIAH